MKIFVKARANAKVDNIKEIDATHFEVWVKELPKDGKANRVIVRVLANYFNVKECNCQKNKSENPRSSLLPGS